MKFRSVSLFFSFAVLSVALSQPAIAQEHGEAGHDSIHHEAANAPMDEKKLVELSEIRRELACYCGCSLTVEDCLRSMRCSESAKLSRQVIDLSNTGKSKPEIIQAMLASYGETILSAPTKKGFNLAAWILPFAALGIGGLIVIIVVKMWAGQGKPAGAPAASAKPAAPAEPDPYSLRIEEELKRLEK
jgi:cytochrome c-type biogenesis protein CcmH